MRGRACILLPPKIPQIVKLIHYIVLITQYIPDMIGAKYEKKYNSEQKNDFNVWSIILCIKFILSKKLLDGISNAINRF